MAYLATADELSGSGAPSTTSIEALVRDAVDIKSVADATAQAQAVTDWPTATGAAISAANPVRVWRQDLDALNISEDGTTWHTLYGGESAWTSVPLNTGFTGTLYVRKVGSVTHLRGTVTRTAGTYPASYSAIATLPAGYRPNVYVRLAVGGYASGTANGLVVNVTTAGVVEIGGIGASMGDAYLTGLSFLLG